MISAYSIYLIYIITNQSLFLHTKIMPKKTNKGKNTKNTKKTYEPVKRKMEYPSSEDKQFIGKIDKESGNGSYQVLVYFNKDPIRCTTRGRSRRSSNQHYIQPKSFPYVIITKGVGNKQYHVIHVYNEYEVVKLLKENIIPHRLENIDNIEEDSIVEFENPEDSMFDFDTI